MAWTTCKYEECPKSLECDRFKIQDRPDSVEINFKAICGEWNNWKYWWESEKNVVEINNKKELE